MAARPKYRATTWEDVHQIGSTLEADGLPKRIYGLELEITAVVGERTNTSTGAVGFECRGDDDEGEAGRLVWWEWDGHPLLGSRVRIRESVWVPARRWLSVALLDVFDPADDDTIPPTDGEPTLEGLSRRVDELEGMLARIRDAIHWRGGDDD